MQIEQHTKVRQYLDDICALIKYREVHPQIRMEILSHIEETVDHLVQTEVDPEQALDRALEQMGDAVTLGEQLNQTHKPRMEWSLILLVGSLVSLGLIALYTIEANDLLSYTSVYSSIFVKSLAYAFGGMILAIACSLLDYRKLAPFSKYLFIATVVVTMLVFLSGPITGGYKLSLGFITVDFVSMAPYLLIIALAGVFANWEWTDRFSLLTAFVLLVVPMVVFLNVPSMASAVLYGVAFLVLMRASAATWRHLLLVSAVPFLTVLGALITDPYRATRLFGFLQPEKDPQGAGYIYL